MKSSKLLMEEIHSAPKPHFRATSAIQMLDADNGYSGGKGGWIYKTDDGGFNLNILGSIGTLLDISFPF